MDRNLFSNTVDIINETYDQFLASADVQKSWNAVNATIIDYHCRQLECLGVFLELKELFNWRILDFGCGTGRLAGDLVEFGANPELIVGVDIRVSFLEQAYRRFPNNVWVLYDGIDLPFKNESFDLVCQSTVFSSIPDNGFRIYLAKELERVTAANGYLFWWDKVVTCEHTDGVPLFPQDFLSWPSEIVYVRRKQLPSTSIRNLRGVGRLIGSIVDRITRYPVTHLAAFLGPKCNLERPGEA